MYLKSTKTIWILLGLVIIGLVVWASANSEFSNPANSKPWQQISRSEPGSRFNYPLTLNTSYIHLVDQKVKVRLAPETLACSGETRQIEGADYCITTSSEGAAGSVYTTYKYLTPSTDRVNTIEVNFTLQAVACGNYADPKKKECEDERSAFNPDTIIPQIILMEKSSDPV